MYRKTQAASERPSAGDGAAERAENLHNASNCPILSFRKTVS
ncbi:hypothetical protein NMH_1127 [Neisseria meningitidis H44/76]|uniref:Uncharacterized protein n=2 Tax=Neisseria meningitidis TaxID=487 RepID=E6MWT4_NEIMH|nr:hypothetical protein NMA510612_1559 [Neisseria meningitidis]EFV64047.1 hypothetical protein NMH_1127 [Neisseria meningitidis H44/76]KER39648.1 hypothetical protein F528_1431 [Neisseria meningitidis 992008]